MRRQRIMGFILIVISIAILLFAITGSTPEEWDVTAVLLILPLGGYMMFTMDKVLYDDEMEPEPYPKVNSTAELHKTQHTNPKQKSTHFSVR